MSRSARPSSSPTVSPSMTVVMVRNGPGSKPAHAAGTTAGWATAG
jgi:hypothetical protein